MATQFVKIGREQKERGKDVNRKGDVIVYSRCQFQRPSSVSQVTGDRSSITCIGAPAQLTLVQCVSATVETGSKLFKL